MADKEKKVVPEENVSLVGAFTGFGGPVAGIKNKLPDQKVMCTIDSDATGTIRAYLDGVSVGRVMPETHQSWSAVAKKIAPNGQPTSAEELSQMVTKDGGIEVEVFNVIPVGTFVFRVVGKADGNVNDESETAEPEPVVEKSEVIEKALDEIPEANREAVRERVNHLRKWTSVNDKVLVAFIEWFKTFDKVESFVSSYVNAGKADYLGDAVKSILIGSNIRLVGPKGTGKNTFAKHVASLFNLGLAEIGMHKHSTEADVYGGMTMNKDGAIEFQPSMFASGLQKPDIVVVDEMNMAPPAVLSTMHSVTDNRRELLIPNYGTIKLHPKCRIVATMNEGESYHGISPMNAAFIDRFHSISFEADPDMMKDIILKSLEDTPYRISKQDATKFSVYYREVFLAVQASYEGQSNLGEELTEDVLSIRSFIEAATRYACGFDETVYDALENCYLKKIDSINPEEAAVVRQIFTLKKI